MIKSITGALARKRATLNENEKGFTLIELLVVVIIIGILAAIAIPIFLGQQESAKGSAVESAIANAKIDVVASIVEGTTFPTNAAIAPDDTDIVLTIAGDESAFCIQGRHADVAVVTWAADDTSGVLERATCVGSVATITTTTP